MNRLIFILVICTGLALAQDFYDEDVWELRYDKDSYPGYPAIILPDDDVDKIILDDTDPNYDESDVGES